MTMDDDARLRLLALVERDGGKDRMLYRLAVTARIVADGEDGTTVTDWIDPAFAELDAGMLKRPGISVADAIITASARPALGL
jgi:hypothetical protein